MPEFSPRTSTWLRRPRFLGLPGLSGPSGGQPGPPSLLLPPRPPAGFGAAAADLAIVALLGSQPVAAPGTLAPAPVTAASVVSLTRLTLARLAARRCALAAHTQPVRCQSGYLSSVPFSSGKTAPAARPRPSDTAPAAYALAAARPAAAASGSGWPAAGRRRNAGASQRR